MRTFGTSLAWLPAASLLFSAAAQTPASAPLTTLQATARTVYIDVVVRDGGGTVRRGFPESAFALKEDGVPQRIVLFQEHAGAPAPRPPMAAGPPAVFRNVADVPVDSSLNVVLLDLLDTPVTEQLYAREQMITFLRALPPGRQVALFVLNGGLHMIQGFTRDSDTLVKVAQAIHPREINRDRGTQQQMLDVDLENYIDSQALFGMKSHIEEALRTEDRQNLKVRLDVLADAFNELASALNGYPGRKNLFWLAGTFPSSTTGSLQAISTGSLSSAGAPQLGAGARQSNLGGDASGGLGSASVVGLTPLSERADRAVADSQIAIYPISVTGVETDMMGAGMLGSSQEQATDSRAQAFHDRAESRAVMNDIARETGGEAFYGSNDIAHMLTRGFEDSEDYYTLAFQPSNHEWTGQYRKLAVSLKEHGYSLSYRRGYYALPEAPHGSDQKHFQQAMKISTPPSTMLSLSGAPSLTTDASPQVRVSAKLDVRGIGFTTDAEGIRHARLEVGMMAYSTVADGSAPRQVAGVMNLALTETQYADLLREGVLFQQKLPLPAGSYVVRTGVLDLGTGRVGTLTIPVRVPGK